METIQSYILDFVKAYGADVFWIIVLFFIGRVVLKKIVKRATKLAVGTEMKGDRMILEKRAETLGGIIIATGNVVIYVIILLMVLNLFEVNIAPILAGAGIVGLAVGFGAQSLVKDFVAGLFILIENQYSVGDKVQIGSFEGKVEKITIRSTTLRNEEGKTFYISNGLIKDVTNFSQARSNKE